VSNGAINAVSAPLKVPLSVLGGGVSNGAIGGVSAPLKVPLSVLGGALQLAATSATSPKTTKSTAPRRALASR
jgi:hypothetical protein